MIMNVEKTTPQQFFRWSTVQDFKPVTGFSETLYFWGSALKSKWGSKKGRVQYADAAT